LSTSVLRGVRRAAHPPEGPPNRKTAAHALWIDRCVVGVRTLDFDVEFALSPPRAVADRALGTRLTIVRLGLTGKATRSFERSSLSIR